MAMSIKNSEVETLARKVAAETGESLTEAIQRALEERWQKLQGKRRSRALHLQIDDLLRRVDSLPTIDSRPEDEILGYDQHGLPR